MSDFINTMLCGPYGRAMPGNGDKELEIYVSMARFSAAMSGAFRRPSMAILRPGEELHDLGRTSKATALDLREAMPKRRPPFKEWIAKQEKQLIEAFNRAVAEYAGRPMTTTPRSRLPKERNR